MGTVAALPGARKTGCIHRDPKNLATHLLPRRFRELKTAKTRQARSVLIEIIFELKATEAVFGRRQSPEAVMQQKKAGPDERAGVEIAGAEGLGGAVLSARRQAALSVPSSV